MNKLDDEVVSTALVKFDADLFENITDPLTVRGQIVSIQVTTHDSNYFSEIYDVESEAKYGGLFSFEMDSMQPEFSLLTISFSELEKLVDKTIGFKLAFDDLFSCNLTVDFYSSRHSTVYTEELKALTESGADETFVYYEAVIEASQKSAVRFDVDLKRILADWCDLRYSIMCLKCDSNLSLMISNDILQVKSITSVDSAQPKLLFEDLIIQIDRYVHEGGEETQKSLLNIRIYMLDNEMRRLNYYDSFLPLSNERPKRFLTPTKVHNQRMSQMQTANAIKLAISEETIGLQTKLKIYDYEWSDYQLNASDYVKERIQIISPQNFLNITKPFDFEEGGAMHNFQIIFNRKSNKRPSNYIFLEYHYRYSQIVIFILKKINNHW